MALRSNEDKQELATFFCDLANIEEEDLKWFKDWKPLSERIERLYPEAVKRAVELDDERDRLTGEGFLPLPIIILHVADHAHAAARRVIPTLIDGKEHEVELPPTRTTWRAYRRGREVEIYPDAEAARPHEQILVDFISVLRLKPFPFRRCATCSRIFVGRKRGKPALYCSRRCKLKGIPSAATKAQYMRGLRDRSRRMETASAIEAIRDCPDGEQLDRLARSVVGRRKTRRKLVFLLKRARAASRSASQPGG